MARRSIPDGPGGFTIVETMLVLAVAGFIMLVVLMAIPALERSSRNDQRKQDIQAILGAVSHYKLSNSGSMPDSGSNFLKYTQLTYYDSNVTYLPGGIGRPATTGINMYTVSPTPLQKNESNKNLDTVDIYDYRKCGTTPSGDPGSTNRGAGFGDVVALYAVETGSGVESQCQQM